MKKIPIRQLASKQKPTDNGQFTIRRLEHILKGSDMVHDLHRHSFFFILFINEGAGLHEIDFVRYEVRDHTLFFLRPGQVHRLQLKAGSTGYLAEFNPEFYSRLKVASNLRLRKASFNNYCTLSPEGFARLETILHLIADEYIRQETDCQQAIGLGLELFLIEFVRQSLSGQGPALKNQSYTQERFEEFSSLLDESVSAHKSVSFYTRQLNLSAYQLNEITKASVGKTASELINEHIVLEAKRYLLATTIQVKEIADQLGYEDPSYFIRFFKKHTGHSPEAFRQHFV